jgi:hypothetical protein
MAASRNGRADNAEASPHGRRIDEARHDLAVAPGPDRIAAWRPGRAGDSARLLPRRSGNRRRGRPDLRHLQRLLPAGHGRFRRSTSLPAAGVSRSGGRRDDPGGTRDVGLGDCPRGSSGDAGGRLRHRICHRLRRLLRGCGDRAVAALRDRDVSARAAKLDPGSCRCLAPRGPRLDTRRVLPVAPARPGPSAASHGGRSACRRHGGRGHGSAGVASGSAGGRASRAPGVQRRGTTARRPRPAGSGICRAAG